MGLFDVLKFGDKNAIGVTPGYDAIIKSEQEHEKLINNEVSRIHEETKMAADRMQRVQLTTGEGVNRKLQSYYDQLTGELKEVISKNPNYKTDPFQAQQVNSVIGKFSNNSIIANDQQSKASYERFKDMASKGFLSTREIADAEVKWKQYQDGGLDTFDFSKAKRVDYASVAMQAAQSITQLNRKNGYFRNVSHDDFSKVMKSVFTNPEMMDQLVADFRSEVPLEEKATFLGIPHKPNMTSEEREALEKDVNEHMDELASSNKLANPILKYAEDKFYPYTRQEYDQVSLINMRGAWSHPPKGKDDDSNFSYFENDFATAVRSADNFMANNPNGQTAFNTKLSAIESLFSKSRNELPVSNRMFIHTNNGTMIPISESTLGYAANTNKAKGNFMYNGKVIVSKGTKRIAATAEAFVPKENMRNFISSMGFTISKTDDGSFVFQRKGFKQVVNASDNDSAMQKFIIEKIGGSYYRKETAGVGGIINSAEGVIVAYEPETDSGIFNVDTMRKYDQEARMARKKYQIEYDEKTSKTGQPAASTGYEFSPIP